MSILKILPSAVDPTANYTFGRVISNGVDLNEAVAAAYNAANTVSPLDSYARQTANAAFDSANTKLSTSGGTITGNLIVNTVTANTITANGVDLGVATAAAFVLANSANRTTTSNTAPTSPKVGDIWYDTVTNVSLRYTNDGVSNNWIDISGPQNAGFIFQSYSLSSNTSSLNETTNTSVALTVSTINIADGTTLYWTISGSTGPDFTDGSNSGSVNITNNSGTIIRTLVADVTTEGAESFVAQLRTGSTSGPIVAIAPVITVADTSQAPANYSVDYLVVAGGGAGANYGAGGAGGLLANTTNLTTTVTYTVTIGSGGAQASTTTSKGTNGTNSSVIGTGFSTLTAIGGGAGGSFTDISINSHGSSGGSGGGAGIHDGPAPSYIQTTGARGTGTVGPPRQGYDGGLPNGLAGSGGGGAGGVGGNATANGGNGGIGVSSSITGTSVFYAGGGGGGINSSGGQGGGGAGGNSSATSGTINTGGGGGATNASGLGATGGSGVIIFRHLTGATDSAGTLINPSYTGSPTITTAGGYTIYTFTGSGTFTA